MTLSSLFHKRQEKKKKIKSLNRFSRWDTSLPLCHATTHIPHSPQPLTTAPTSLPHIPHNHSKKEKTLSSLSLRLALPHNTIPHKSLFTLSSKPLHLQLSVTTFIHHRFATAQTPPQPTNQKPTRRRLTNVPQSPPSSTLPTPTTDLIYHQLSNTAVLLQHHPPPIFKTHNLHPTPLTTKPP